jgi:hypothetical protein
MPEVPEEDTEQEETSEPVEDTAKETPTSDEIMADFKNFEDILNSINFDDIETEEEGDESE